MGDMGQQLERMNKKEAENALRTEEIKQERQGLNNALTAHQERKEVLKKQQYMIDNEHEKLQIIFEDKVRKELSHEKEDLEKQRRTLEKESSRQKTLRANLKREQVAAKK